MNPNRVDLLIDLTYGVLILVSIVLIVVVQFGIGIGFGVGVIVSYLIHVTWKMARFDPEWMTREVTEKIEETVTREVTESVGERVAREVSKDVEEKVAQEVTESIEETVTEEITPITHKLEEVDERLDRRPRADEVEAQVDELATGGEGAGREETAEEEDSP